MTIGKQRRGEGPEAGKTITRVRPSAASQDSSDGNCCIDRCPKTSFVEERDNSGDVQSPR
jgi:hypothetical protein